MPELPEVATLARGLAAVARGKKLSDVRFSGEERFRDRIVPMEVRVALKLMCEKSVRVSSAGKHLILASSECRVAIHLGMTGQFQITPVTQNYSRHRFLTLTWPGVQCHFLDFRRFARMRIVSAIASGALGGYSEGGGFYLANHVMLRNALRGALNNFKNMPRISWLLMHGRITGVGNYIANEALGRLDLSPYHPCRSEDEAYHLLRASQRVAAESFALGGTSFGIGYAHLDGSRGAFAKKLRFYKNRALRYELFRGRPIYSRFRLPRRLRRNA